MWFIHTFCTEMSTVYFDNTFLHESKLFVMRKNLIYNHECIFIQAISLENMFYEKDPKSYKNK